MRFRLRTSPDSSFADLGTPPAAAVAKPAALEDARPRIHAIDFLRGLVMMIMVLDHTRDFVGMGGLNPRDVNDAPLFLTRWITHFCAPVFVFLCGASAYLWGTRGRTTGELSTFLFTRGLWFVVLELTLVRLGWTFSLKADFLLFGVIWVIGASMIVLSALVHLPRRVVGAFGLALILGHNLLDGLKAVDFGVAGVLWNFLHDPARLQPAPGLQLIALYPLIPWLGVMAAGYALAPVMQWPFAKRRPWLIGAGLALTAGFVLLRASNLYGDPAPWTVQESMLATALAFINCEKYPPSLLYLAMTLGPALLLLAYCGERRAGAGNIVVTLGRVPLVFYVAHIFLAHAVAVGYAEAVFGDSGWLFMGPSRSSKPDGYGLGLPIVYGFWLALIAMLYPLCRWFAALKQRRRDWWLSYL